MNNNGNERLMKKSFPPFLNLTLISFLNNQSEPTLSPEKFSGNAHVSLMLTSYALSATVLKTTLL
jgi:hypothetical protein